MKYVWFAAFSFIIVSSLHSAASNDNNKTVAGDFVLKTNITDEIAKSYQEQYFSDVTDMREKILQRKLSEAFSQEAVLVESFTKLSEIEDEEQRYAAKQQCFKANFDRLPAFRAKIIALVHMGLSPFTDLCEGDFSLFDYFYDIDDNLTHYLLLKRKGSCSLKEKITGCCRSEAMIKHFYKAGVPFDLLDIFWLHGYRDNGNVEKMLIEGGAKIDIRSEKGETPLEVRLSAMSYVYNHAHGLYGVDLNEIADPRALIFLVKAGAERNVRFDKEKCTPAECIREEFVKEFEIASFASVADYMDSFGLTLRECTIRSIILNARNKQDPESLELIEIYKGVCVGEVESEQNAMPFEENESALIGAKQNILNVLKDNQKLFDVCLDELMPERSIAASDHVG
jgi:hypothetical protein